MALEVELVSPERIAFSGEAKMVICRTTTGDIAFLPGHVPFIGVLATHPVRLQMEDGTEQVIAVHQGFVEVSPPDADGNTRVTILSDVAELADTIDIDRARAAKERAEEILRSDAENPEARAALVRAEVRLTVADAA
ncbi:ATP synthase F1 subunit epsilon [Dermatobacter hominis]|uniref:ATP synthase F1 subunit epsilon n=1 Tax=Dermatobacter hominis TaxID=2884263 RepID=UPI001D10E181|nr:ATP synthase F1 subunit epsilon [Dermatobacter hominis]UDY37200.1 ATP synthase F1 subunit epsilon [Dermatobacter hominis]